MIDLKKVVIKEKKVDTILTKSNLPIAGYSINPYVGCPFGCEYCYATFMKRFTGHKEDWGMFLDVKMWDKIKNPEKYKGKTMIVGSVTDGYNYFEAKYKRTRAFLEEMQGSEINLIITTKSNLVTRDIDLIKTYPNPLVAWSINTLDEEFKKDMDSAPTIKSRIEAMKQVHDAGIRTTCFISPIFPGITDVFTIIEEIKDFCDYIWLENLNLRGTFKPTIINYIKEKDWFPVWYTIDVIVEILFYSVINLKLIQDILLCLKGQNVIQDVNVYIYLFVIAVSLWNFVETIYIKNENRCESNKIKYTQYFDSNGNRIAVSDQVVYKNKIYKIYMVNGEWYLSDGNKKEDIKLEEAVCDVSRRIKVYSWEMGRRGYSNNT